MGVRVLHDRKLGYAALYCSTTDWAFGPVFYEDEEVTAADQAEVFNDWLPQDARRYTDSELSAKYGEWLRLEKCWDHLTVKPCERCEIEQEELENIAKGEAATKDLMSCLPHEERRDWPRASDPDWREA